MSNQNSKKHLGHTARKRFGQNFLHDMNVIHNIVAAINPKNGQFLLEIGPGLGALTEPVAEQVDKLTVVESAKIDRRDGCNHHQIKHHAGDARKHKVVEVLSASAVGQLLEHISHQNRHHGAD